MYILTFRFSDRKQIIAAIVFTCILKSVHLQQCNKLTFNKKHFGQRLVGFKVMNSTEDSIGTCVKKCFQLTHCLSTNFDTVSKQCDLNNITADEMTTAIVKSDTSILSDLSAWPKAMVGPCEDKPCNGRDICLPAGNSFLCRNSDCPKAPVFGNTTSTGSVDIGGHMVYTCTQPRHRIIGQDYLQCGWMNTWSSNVEITCVEPEDCLELRRQDISLTSGVHQVRSPYTGSVLSLYCDMTTDGGGWTVFQKRFNGNLDFYRTFKEYDEGFGDVQAEFWLGLRHIQEMTSHHITELRIDLTAADSTTAYQTFQNFSLSPGPDYTLHIGQSAGTAGDGPTYGLTYHNGQRFTTKDRDVDNLDSINCAELEHGGWWYKQCTSVNLNGDYVTPGTLSSYNRGYGGVTYLNFHSTNSLKTTRMMFRRK